jgi:hypothetical protein
MPAVSASTLTALCSGRFAMTKALRAQSPFHCLKIFRKWTLKLHPLSCERVRECKRGGMKTQARTWLCASIEDIADNGMS